MATHEHELVGRFFWSLAWMKGTVGLDSCCKPVVSLEAPDGDTKAASKWKAYLPLIVVILVAAVVASADQLDSQGA
ncbi:MAG TPA: hypothetical protein VIY86_06190, partial [Pirellulaceae bacterium]